MIRNPYAGFLIMVVFGFLFAVIYRPLGIHPGRFLGYAATMISYSLISSLAALGMLLVLKKRMDREHWTFPKELFSIVLTLLAAGIGAYLAGFILEEPANRLNLATLMDSLRSAFLIGLVPFGFFTAINFQSWLFGESYQQGQSQAHNPGAPPEELINIDSQLKSESLSFFPREFLYAESEGNYVNFYLLRHDKVHHEVIRNTINNIEQQLSGLPFIMRTHRAFIVNLKKVELKKGTSLGYNLKLAHVQPLIPVSRNNTREFSQRMKKLINNTSR
ncbi:MAG: LytTR family DNA-binding domain-containing protein [Bacteroidales bacterium]